MYSSLVKDLSLYMGQFLFLNGENKLIVDRWAEVSMYMWTFLSLMCIAKVRYSLVDPEITGSLSLQRGMEHPLFSKVRYSLVDRNNGFTKLTKRYGTSIIFKG